MSLPTDSTETDERLELLLSIQRSKASHWLEAHPEPWRPQKWWEYVLNGFALMVLRPEREPVHVVFERCWAKAVVQTCDEVAREHDLTLQTFSRDDISWWETLAALSIQ